MLLAQKVTNNKTEDEVYCYSGTFSYADSLSDLVVNKHLTRLDAQSVRSFEAGTNISLKEASTSGQFALVIKLNNGESISKLNMSYELMAGTLTHRNDICSRGAIIFKMEDCKTCSEAIVIYDDIIAKEKLKSLMSISEFADLICVNAQTLRNWDKSDKLKPALVSSDGRRMYTFSQSLEYLTDKKDTRNKGIGYAVKGDSALEAELAIKNYFKTIGCEDYTIIEDENSGINSRDAFKDTIRSILSGKVSHLAVVEKNMALPLGNLDLFELVLQICGCKLHRIY